MSTAGRRQGENAETTDKLKKVLVTHSICENTLLFVKKRLLPSQNRILFKVGKVEKRGFDTMAKLVYIDNFPITKVVNSPRLQLMYRQLNYDRNFVGIEVPGSDKRASKCLIGADMQATLWKCLLRGSVEILVCDWSIFRHGCLQPKD